MPRPAGTSATSIPHWLHAGFAAGRAHYGDLPIDLPTFRDCVTDAARRRLPAAGARITRQSVARTARRLALRDLYLACACERRSEAAWVALQGAYSLRLASLLRQHGFSAATARDIVADLPGILIAPTQATGRALIAGFDGAGPLFGWLATIALREAWRQWRLNRRETQVPAEPTPATAEPDDAATAETRERFQGALRLAWERLPMRARTVLALRYGQGLQQIQIVRVLGIGAPAVCRALDRAVREVRSCVRAALGDDVALPGPVWRLLRDAVGSELGALRERAE